MTTEMVAQIIDQQRQRQSVCRLMLVQLRAHFDSYFREEAGLIFHKDPLRIMRRLERFLALADEKNVDLLVFPELSIPPEAAELFKRWTRKSDGIVVAGSHYRQKDGGYVACAPVIFPEEIFLTEKIVPSPLETAVVAESEGIQPGSQLYVFTHTKVGSFAVLICSDYLAPQIRFPVLSGGLDLLCVISCQRDSLVYHDRIHSDCCDAEDGLYVAYTNLLCSPYGDGRSAVFGVAHNQFRDQLKRGRWTDGEPASKLTEIPEPGSYLICELDLETKRPAVGRTVHDRSNFRILTCDWMYSAKQRGYQRRRDSKGRYKMVFFDLDGCLIRGEKFGWTLIWKYLGEQGRVDPELQRVYMKRYLNQRYLSGQERIAAYRRWCEDAVEEFQKAKLKAADFKNIARRATLTRNFFETLGKIRSAGLKTFVVSGGVDRLMYEVVPNIRTVMDEIYINVLLFSGREECVEGVKATQYDFEGKLTLIEGLCYENDVELDEVVHVADAFNDEFVMTKVGKAIAYSSHPDGEIETLADAVIREDDLSLLIPHILVSD